MAVSILWFRRDLRLADNPALKAAVENGRVVPVLLMPTAIRRGERGAAAFGWLQRSARSLDESLRERGSSLVIRTGEAPGALARLAHECKADTVFCQRLWTPDEVAEEESVSVELARVGCRLSVHESRYLVPPDALLTSQGGPYRVFTSYHRAWLREMPLPCLSSAPERIPSPTMMPATAGPLSPSPGGPDIARWWTPGEHGALKRLSEFVSGAAARYSDEHDRTDLDGTSRLSPHLAFGEVAPHRVVDAVLAALGPETAAPFVRQLAWREFAANVLHHHPSSRTEPLRPEFAGFPWRDDPQAVEAWRRGSTGFPLVDAGMRQLAMTGWMHNRARLVCGSFLTKDLLIGWRRGEELFACSLVDLDDASNAFNWQWVAGSGADAAPYFRVFNPTVQGRRFDPDGEYVRTWVPELARLAGRWIHEPWAAGADVLREAGVELGRDYPEPVVSHAEARARALAAHAAMRAGATSAEGSDTP